MNEGGDFVINYIWMFLIGLSVAIAIITGHLNVVSETIFSSSTKAIEFTMGLAGMIAFWSGILKVAEAAGVNETVARFFQPILAKIFPTLKNDQEILGLISLTISANLLGLGNVTTPLGLKAISELQSKNANKDRVSDEICTFMALVFGGLSVIPSTLIAVRSKAGSINPALILGPVFIITSAATIAGLIFNFFLLKFTYWFNRKK